QNGNWPAEWSESLPLYREYDSERPSDHNLKGALVMSYKQKRYVIGEADGGVTSEQHYTGGYSFRITHKTRRDRLWSSVSQQVPGLNPTSSYVLGFWVKAVDLKGAFAVLDPRWARWKCNVPDGTYEWRFVRCPNEFGPGDKLGIAEVRFLTDWP